MPQPTKPKKPSIMIWDLPTRVFHWLLAATIFYSWFSVDILEDMDQHFYAGYTALTLILFRGVWGFVGSYHSRFNHFPIGIAKVKSHIKSFLLPSSTRYLGHNPLGSLSALIMLSLVLFQTLTGLFSSDGYYVYGPFAEIISSQWVSRASDLHALNVNLLFVIIALHILAILFYQFFKKQSLTLSMLTGKKILDKYQLNNIEENKSAQSKPPILLKGAAIILCCGLLVWLVVVQ